MQKHYGVVGLQKSSKKSSKLILNQNLTSDKTEILEN